MIIQEEQKAIHELYRQAEQILGGRYDYNMGVLFLNNERFFVEEDSQADTFHWYDVTADRMSVSFELTDTLKGISALAGMQ